MVRVLVTGGAGYIGSHTVRALREAGDEVTILDLRPLPDPRVLPGAPAVQGDIADGPLVERLLRDRAIEAVIHFAGFKSVAESMTDPGRYFRNNVAGSLALLDAMVATGVGRFVFSSSCSVYGNPAHSPVDESAAIRPISPYAESKAMVERMLTWYGTVHGLRSMALRYFNAAGAHPAGDLGEDWDTSTMLLPAVLKAAAGRRPPVDINGTDLPTPDGTAIRDYIHVVDLADAHVRALRALDAGDPPGAVNLGTGVGSSVRQVLDLVERVTGRPVPVRYGPRRAGDPAAVWADPSLARQALGWVARHDLESMVRTAWARYAALP